MQNGNAIPTRGLIILPDPLEKILNGSKTLELRSKRNSIRGPFALIQKGSGLIVGVANIGESIGPMDFADFVSRKNEHGVEESRLQQVFDSGRTIGWKLSDVQRLRTAILYVHKPGAVTWVTLDAAAIAGLQKASPSKS